MEMLLNKYPYARIGNNLNILKAEDYFKDVDWDKLVNKQ